MQSSIVGSTGVVIVTTRGADGPGEVSVRTGGGTESLLAWSHVPLARGTEIVVVNLRGPRTVEVVALDEPDAPPSSSGATSLTL